MAVRKFKPTTPGQRHKIIGTYEEITASVPEKSLVFGKISSGGRNNEGQMTMRYLGGGHKKKIRIVDFKRNKDGVPAVVKTVAVGFGTAAVAAGAIATAPVVGSAVIVAPAEPPMLIPFCTIKFAFAIFLPFSLHCPRKLL